MQHKHIEKVKRRAIKITNPLDVARSMSSSIKEIFFPKPVSRRKPSSVSSQAGHKRANKRQSNASMQMISTADNPRLQNSVLKFQTRSIDQGIYNTVYFLTGKRF